jgi:hypothetical protein
MIEFAGQRFDSLYTVMNTESGNSDIFFLCSIAGEMKEMLN